MAETVVAQVAASVAQTVAALPTQTALPTYRPPATSTPLPTYTPPATFTPLPTYTALPTYTPPPTATMPPTETSSPTPEPAATAVSQAAAPQPAAPQPAAPSGELSVQLLAASKTLMIGLQELESVMRGVQPFCAVPALGCQINPYVRCQDYVVKYEQLLAVPSFDVSQAPLALQDVYARFRQAAGVAQNVEIVSWYNSCQSALARGETELIPGDHQRGLMFAIFQDTRDLLSGVIGELE